MRYFVLLIIWVVSFGAKGQSDTIFTDDLRATMYEVFSELDVQAYGGKLIERSVSDFSYVYEQLKGNYAQTHDATSWLLMYDAIIDSYVDSTAIISKDSLVARIMNFYYEMEMMDTPEDEDEKLLVPFSLLIHKTNAFDSIVVANGGVVNNNGKLSATVSQNTLYKSIVLKSAAALEFFSDNGFDLGYLKYDERFISTSDEIELEGIRINLGGGFTTFDVVNNLIPYNRFSDSIVAQAEITYYLDNVLTIDTLDFYLTLDVGDMRDANMRAKERWDHKYTYYGEEINLRVAIKYGCGNNNKIRRPIIIAPPYRPTIHWVHMNKYYDQFDFKSVLFTLSEMGYDVIFLKEKPGNARIEEAGREIARFIHHINNQKSNNFPGQHWENILMGFSAGGQHARYALMHLEKEHMYSGAGHHHTRLFVPFDSPNHGANIPMFAQATYFDLTMKSNILALIAFTYLNDGGSRDMAFNHILTGGLTLDTDNYVNIDANPTPQRLQLLDQFENNFTHFYTHTGDLRKTFPTFTRNIGISVGSYVSDYDDIYGLKPGDNLFTQENMFLPTHFGFMHKFRKLYASKYGTQQESLNIRDINVVLGIIPLETWRIYRTNNLYDLDMAQGGYKNEFYDKFATGAISMMLSGFAPSFGFMGQKHYKGHISFVPTISALAINPSIWQNNNLSYNLQSNGLMYQEFDFDPDDGKSDIFGYPHLGNPTNHFQITPFEAVYADVLTYEHIKMQESADDNAFDDNFLVYLRDFIVNEVEADVVCLQNKVIGENHVNWLPEYRYKAWYKAKKTIRVGYDVTPKTNKGDFTIKPSGDVVVYAGESIEVPSGWEALHVQQGATWHAYIYDDGCDRPRSHQGLAQYADDAESTTQEKVVNHFPEATMEPITQRKDEMTLYPNPNSGSFTLQFSAEQVSGTLSITNLSGRTVISLPITTEKLEIQEEGLSSGVYFVTWIKDGTMVQTNKLIIQ